MNTLSWFLYLAEVVGKLGSLASLASVVGVICFFGIAFWWGCWQENKENVPQPPMKPFFIIWIIAIFLSVVVPSKETVYLIAGSQAGEAVVTSETGQEILTDIQAVIRAQLADLKGGKE